MTITEEINTCVDKLKAEGYTDEIAVRKGVILAVMLKKAYKENKTVHDKVHKIIEKHKEVTHGTDEI